LFNQVTEPKTEKEYLTVKAKKKRKHEGKKSNISSLLRRIQLRG
jgi:hypothetical protein